MYNISKKEDINDKANKSRYNYKQIQNDLVRLDKSIENVKEEFKKSIEELRRDLQQSMGTITLQLDNLIEGIFHQNSSHKHYFFWF